MGVLSHVKFVCINNFSKANSSTESCSVVLFTYIQFFIVWTFCVSVIRSFLFLCCRLRRSQLWRSWLLKSQLLRSVQIIFCCFLIYLFFNVFLSLYLELNSIILFQYFRKAPERTAEILWSTENDLVVIKVLVNSLFSGVSLQNTIIATKGNNE